VAVVDDPTTADVVTLVVGFVTQIKPVPEELVANIWLAEP
jgi:hypothetical protein